MLDSSWGWSLHLLDLVYGCVYPLLWVIGWALYSDGLDHRLLWCDGIMGQVFE